MTNQHPGDRTIAVTGAGGLIGSAVATALAEHGACVALIDINEEAARRVAENLGRRGATAIAFAADVADESSVNATFASISAALPPLGGLVTCAAPLSLLGQERPLAQLDVAVWDQIIAVTLRGAMLAMRAAVPQLMRQPGGAIVNLSSIHSQAGDRGLVAYPAAKAAVEALTRSVATQYGRLGIRCNTVSPGTIPPSEVAAEDLERRLRHQSLRRTGLATDVADAVSFLLSDKASFITGQTLVVDGGVLTHLPSFADGGNVQDQGPG
jgi:NAD(P)-dependent dehydrogenase (short-subunit alcohol dehydrogenase family)